MKNVGAILFVATIVVFLGAVVSSTGSHAMPPLTNVLVVNRTAQAVPVAAQGTTVIRDSDNPARQPFNVHLERDLPRGQSQTACPTTLYTVPSGKELVVEYVSLWGVSQNPETPNIAISRPGVQTEYLFFLQRKGTSEIGAPLYGASETTRLYFSPGDAVNYCVTRDQNTDDLGYRIRLSGYLVNLP